MSLTNKNITGSKFGLFLAAFIGLTSVPASAQGRLEVKAESLYNQHKVSQAFDLYNKLVKKNKDDVSVLWHSSLLYSRLGHRLESKNDKIEYFRIAKRRALRSLKQDSKSSMANYAMAVALGRMASISTDLQKKIVASRKIKKYAVRALKIDNTNAGAWDVLSRWNYGFANMDSNKRAAAKLFLGDMVKGTSYEKAAKYAEKAIKFNPSVVSYYRDLAKAYKGLGENEKAVKTCQKSLDKTPLWSEGNGAKKECSELIANLSVKS